MVWNCGVVLGNCRTKEKWDMRLAMILNDLEALRSIANPLLYSDIPSEELDS